ncbi:MAG: hypothetical protein LBS75_01545 [Synergistaceae bacterium]|jgi:hypothetical protein|nr:hypothetical protein [Synergistaceae bacterium]
MTAEKQHALYGVLMAFVVVLFLVAQFVLQHTLKSASEELASVSTNLASEKRTAESRKLLVERYKSFESLAMNYSRSERVFPVNAREFFTAMDKVLKDNLVEYTSRSASPQTTPGGRLELQFSFSGPYYGVLKALAALRENEYVMRVSNLVIEAEAEGRVSGSMSVISTVRS